jgi:hypothetical protein
MERPTVYGKALVDSVVAAIVVVAVVTISDESSGKAEW